MEFPKMLYRAGGPVALQNGAFTLIIVADETEQGQALADGFSLTSTEALAIKEQSDAAAADATKAEAEREAVQALSDASRPPTREELEHMATKLGLLFGPRASDKKLRALIDAATVQ